MADTESDSAVVEQAKGAVMLRYGVSSSESLAAMSRWAQEADITLPDVAHALVKGICQGRITPETRGTVRWLEQRLRADIPDVTHVTHVTDEAEDADATAEAGSSARRRRASTLPPRASATAAIAVARQWRYQSAVRAARALANL